MFNIVPQPNELIITGGKIGFTLNPDTTITKVDYIDEFRDFVKREFDIRIHRDSDAAENAVILSLTDELSEDEGYRLVSRDGCVYIYGKTPNGIFYGLQTLKQLLLQGNGQLPDMYIEDKPRFPYRGFLLDAGGCAWSVKEICRLIDLLALHKFNTLHWRLTSRRRFRMEIPAYALLTEGDLRRDKPEDRFYTQEQIREIVEYCRNRFIRVVPELDILKSASAVALDPKLACRVEDTLRDLFPDADWGAARTFAASCRLDAPYGQVDLKHTYAFDPTVMEDSYGIEAPFVTAVAETFKRAEHGIFPRLGAISEAAWSAEEDRSYERFLASLPEYFDLLNAYHVHYATMKQAMPSFLHGKFQSLRYRVVRRRG